MTRVSSASTFATRAIPAPILVHPKTATMVRPADQFSSAHAAKTRAPVRPSLRPSDTTANNIGWVKHSGPKTHDATSEFEKLDLAAKQGKSPFPPEAKNCVFIAVGGLMSGASPDELYFDQNLDGLKAAGMQVDRAPINTIDSVEHNAKVIADMVKKYAAEGKKVVLIGHSKGGCDSEAALAMYPEIDKDVRGLVTIQTPYGGSPMADDLDSIPGLEQLLSPALDVLGGGKQSCLDLKYEERQKFLAKYPMPKGIPTVCMASNKQSPLSPLFATSEWMKQRYGVQNDGLVAVDDAFIPGSKTVTLQGLDHLDSTVSEHNPFLPYQPGDLTVALAAMVFDKKNTVHS
jgi:triacylglycerol lipase